MKIKAYKAKASSVLFLSFGENILKRTPLDSESYFGYSLVSRKDSTILGTTTWRFFETFSSNYPEITIKEFLSKLRDEDKAATFRILFELK